MDTIPRTKMQRMTPQGLMSDNNSVPGTFGNRQSAESIPDKICCQVAWTDVFGKLIDHCEEMLSAAL